jgi:Arc/MetJ-type ribon-helix-helix transcriptional regulator
MVDYVKKTVNLDKDLVDWIEKQIEQHKFASVTHAIQRAIFEMKEREEK